MGSGPKHFRVAGDFVFFRAQTQGIGEQLWRTDGTPQGTIPLCKLSRWYLEPPQAALDTWYFFVNETSLDGVELWKSDGTPAGTVLVSDICPGECASMPDHFVRFGDAIYFTADDGVHGTELWRSNGTAAGTWMVADGVAGPGSLAPDSLATAGAALFVSGDQGLWRSTGQHGSLAEVSPVVPQSPLVAHGGAVFFVADDAISGRELWRSDGTGAGTAMVADINPAGSSSPAHLVSGPGGLYFAATDGTTGTELWRSDGTAAGTGLVLDIRPSASSSPAHMTVVGDTVYFVADDGTSGVELWASDGTAAGTARVADIRPGTRSSGPSGLTRVGSALYFEASSSSQQYNGLWICNGRTVSAVREFGADFRGGVQVWTYGPAIVDLNGSAVFAADDGEHGAEPWVSEGTTSTTAMLEDLNPGASSSDPRFIVQSGSNVYFTATTDDIYGNRELWASDGTAAGTRSVQAFSATSSLRSSADLAGTLFFWVTNWEPRRELWRSDGTAAGTTRVKSIDDSHDSVITPAGGLLYFAARTPDQGMELWKSDGTDAGTVPVSDLDPGPGSSDPASITAFGSSVVFVAKAPGGGRALWRSDGTANGTTVLNACGKYSSPSDLTVAGGNIFFLSWCDSRYLWASDGARSVGLPFDDIHPVDTSSLAPFGESVVFAGTDGSTGAEPWVWDGTSTSARLLKDVRPGPDGSSPTSFAAAGRMLYFAADDGTVGMELWRSDGTAAGTRLVCDIAAGAASSTPEWMTAVGRLVYFVADDGIHGRELWRTDGTAAGTRMLADLNPGIGASWDQGRADGFTLGSGRLFFRAYEPTVGIELFALDVQVPHIPRRRLISLP